eukprot:12359431-Heterocapsa_arctica.AAC.1
MKFKDYHVLMETQREEGEDDCGPTRRWFGRRKEARGPERAESQKEVGSGVEARSSTENCRRCRQ